MVLVFPPGPPLSPLAFTGVVSAVRGLALLSVLSVVLQEILRNRRTCSEPPGMLGDFVLVKKQGNAAFYDCPGIDVYRHDLTPTCPIIYCQDNGTFSTPDFAIDLSLCNEPDEGFLVVNSTGVVTSANYPSNYNPTSTEAVIVWNIMVPGKKIVFRIEDFDVDSDTTLELGCGSGFRQNIRFMKTQTGAEFVDRSDAEPEQPELLQPTPPVPTNITGIQLEIYATVPCNA